MIISERSRLEQKFVKSNCFEQEKIMTASVEELLRINYIIIKVKYLYIYCRY